MKCPRCGKPLHQGKRIAPDLALVCGACGWGTGAPSADPLPVAERRSASGFRIPLALGWALSLAIVIGPYVAARVAISRLEGGGSPAAVAVAERLLDLLNLHYWWVTLAYLGVAIVFTPTYDPRNLGLSGSSVIDNPLSLEDDHNRMMRGLAILLYPGKLVGATLRHTWRLLGAGQPSRA